MLHDRVGEKGEPASKEEDNKDKDSKGGMEAEDNILTKKGKAKQATTKTLDTIADKCDNVLAFLQAVVVKSPRVISATLSLRAD